MKPVYQTRYGAKTGNCFQACIASLFELNLQDVPDFCNRYDDGSYHKEFVKWLNKKGYSAISVKANSLYSHCLKNCLVLTAGKNKDGIMHQAIYKNGKPVFNPNKKCSGITPEFIDIIFPLDPNKMQFKA